MTSFTPTFDPTCSVPQSGMFLPPGRPRPLARRLAIHNRVVRSIRRFLEAQGFQEIPVCGPDPVPSLATMIGKGFPAVWGESQAVRTTTSEVPSCLPRFKLISAMSTTSDLDQLCGLMENLLNNVTRTLGAELLGGRHVTRLDRSLQGAHPRLTHAEAVKAVNSRGWELGSHDDFPPEAMATLVRYCGNLPVMVTHWPPALKPGFAAVTPGISARVKYILPFAGEVMDGGLWAGPIPRAGWGLGVARLLQYLMGLGSILDTVIVPGSGSSLMSAEATD